MNIPSIMFPFRRSTFPNYKPSPARRRIRNKRLVYTFVDEFIHYSVILPDRSSAGLIEQNISKFLSKKILRRLGLTSVAISRYVNSYYAESSENSRKRHVSKTELNNYCPDFYNSMEMLVHPR
jgi:hypothetical protein